MFGLFHYPSRSLSTALQLRKLHICLFLKIWKLEFETKRPKNLIKWYRENIIGRINFAYFAYFSERSPFLLFVNPAFWIQMPSVGLPKYEVELSLAGTGLCKTIVDENGITIKTFCIVKQIMLRNVC